MAFGLCLLFAVLLLGSLSYDAQATPVIGSATTIVRDVQGQLEKNWRVVVIDDDVHQDELIRTGVGSAARLIFADRTDFMIGSDSQVVLDKFIFDPSSNSGRLVLHATKGLMKFRTGSMPSRSYSIKTPVATVGVRGTEFVLQVLLGGGTYIKVISGEVFVTDHKENSVSVMPGESAIVFPQTDARAPAGPRLVSKGDFGLTDEAREMIAQIVFSESTAQTQLAANGKQASGAQGRGNGAMQNTSALQVNPNATLKPANKMTAVKKSPISPLPLLFRSRRNVPRGLPGSLFNGSFDNGLSGWSFAGRGSATIVPDPADPLNKVLQLTTGSPVSIYQTFKPIGGPFKFEFRHNFLDDEGDLCIFLDPVEPQTGNTKPDLNRTCEADPLAVFSSDVGLSGWTTQVIEIVDPLLFSMDELILTIMFDFDQGGFKVLIDDLDLETLDDIEPKPEAVPLLPAVSFLAAGTLVFGILGWRRRRNAS